MHIHAGTFTLSLSKLALSVKVSDCLTMPFIMFPNCPNRSPPPTTDPSTLGFFCTWIYSPSHEMMSLMAEHVGNFRANSLDDLHDASSKITSLETEQQSTQIPGTESVTWNPWLEEQCKRAPCRCQCFRQSAYLAMLVRRNAVSLCSRFADHDATSNESTIVTGKAHVGESIMWNFFSIMFSCAFQR